MRNEEHFLHASSSIQCGYKVVDLNITSSETNTAVRVTSVMRLDTSKRWSPYIDECLQGLSDQLECPGDAVLVALSRFTQITESAAGGLSSGLRSGTVEAGRAIMLDITSLRMALDSVKVGLGPQLLQNSKCSLVVIQNLKC